MCFPKTVAWRSECGELSGHTFRARVASLTAGGCRKQVEVSEESKLAQERKSQLKYLPSPERGTISS